MRIHPKTPDELIAQNCDVRASQPEAAMSRDAQFIAGDGMRAYVAALRKERREREWYFYNPINNFVGSIVQRPEAEARIIEQLRTRIIDVQHPEQAKFNAETAFPSGTFLFHGAKTSSLVDILRSGYLMNARALGEKPDRTDNGGEEGISWSLGNIEAIPATRYHMAGFMASPEKMLGAQYQLAVPDNPAPYEVVQLSGNIDSAEFYEIYTQARLCELVYDGLCQLLEVSDQAVPTIANDPSELRKYYHKNAAGELIFSRDLSSRVDESGETFAAEVWIKAATEGGNDNHGELSLEAHLCSVERRILQLAAELRSDVTPQNDVRVPVEKLYFVTPRKDVEMWLRVLARCAAKPMGIIAYDNTNVRLEDFVSEHRGDGGKLATQLRTVVGERSGQIDFDKVLGVEFKDSMRDGKKPYVISPVHLGNTKRLILRDGQLTVDK